MGNRYSLNFSFREQSSSSFNGCDDSNLSQRFFHRKRESFSTFSKSSLQSNGSRRCQLQKPLCRISRKRRRDSTFLEISGVSKTVWPVKVSESLFLPEFKINCGIEKSNIEKIEEIGRGAFSQVFKVKILDSGEQLAMKIIAKAKIMEENLVNQVKDEIKIHSSCGHHPFIASWKYNWQNHRFLFIVSEYVSGGELWELLHRHNTLPEDLVRIYIAEIAMALDFLHNAGVIYRDLKLENIILDESGHIKLIDFGLAKFLKYGARTSTVCGTCQFMAPEVFEGDYGHSVDWWSLGVLAYLLLNGEYPASVQLRMAQVEVTEDTLPTMEPRVQTTVESGSAAARDLTCRLLQADPQLRLRSLISLKNIAFFKGFHFDDIMSKKISLKNIFPLSEPRLPQNQDIFEDFDLFSI